MAPELYVQRDQPPGVPPLHLTGERTLPDVPEENYWFRRHLAVYEWIAARVHGRRVVDLACGEGYGSGRARPHGGVRRRRRRQPGRVRARAAEVHGRARPLRARHDRDLDGRRRLRRVPADDRARAGPRRGARAAARPRRAGRRRLRLDAERAHARAAGRAALGQPVARARVPPGGVPRAVRAPLRAGRPARAVPRAQAARSTSSRSSTRAGTPSTRGSASRTRFYDRFTPGDLRARLPRCAGARSSARSTCSPCCAHEPPRRRAGDRPAHPHALRRGLRHVAVRRGVAVGGDRHLVPAAARRARRGARPRDALGHAGARPTSSRRRARSTAASRSCARSGRETHRLDLAGAAGPARRRRSSTPRRLRGRRGRARRGDLVARLARHATWTSAATHAVLPLLATARGVRLQLATGIAAHRARFGDWGGGLWLPECAHAPWLDPLLEEAGVHADVRRPHGRRAPDPRTRCARRRARCSSRSTARRSSSCGAADGYPSRGAYRDTHRLTEHRHQAWAVDGGPYDPARGAAQARADARDFVAARRARATGSRRGARHGAARAALARGAAVAAEVLGRRRGRAAVRPLSAAVAEVEAAPAPALPVTSWGTPRDLSHLERAARRRARLAPARVRAARGGRGAGGLGPGAARAARAADLRLGVSRLRGHRRRRTRRSAPRGTRRGSRRRSPIRTACRRRSGIWHHTSRGTPWLRPDRGVVVRRVRMLPRSL